jgi:hypothetical protein
MDERLDNLEARIVTAYADGDLAGAQSVARYAARLEWQLQGTERRRAMAIAIQAQEAVALIEAGQNARPQPADVLPRYAAAEPDTRPSAERGQEGTSPVGISPLS